MKNESLVHDARRFPIGWRLWFYLLLGVNFVAPLFFLGRPEARGVLAAYAVASVVIVFLHRRLGWVRLLGLGHFPWLALLPWLVFRYATTSPTGAFAAFLIAVLLVDTACLAIDAVDLVRYRRGERGPIVSPRPGAESYAFSEGST
jgi:hypothetical protein